MWVVYALLSALFASATSVLLIILPTKVQYNNHFVFQSLSSCFLSKYIYVFPTNHISQIDRPLLRPNRPKNSA